MSTDSAAIDLNEEAKHWAGLRVAHEAMMLDDATQVLKQGRELDAAYNRQLGFQVEPEKDVAVRVGNDYVTHNYPAPPATAAVPVAAKGLSTLAKTGIAAALLGSGAAVPLAVNALWPDEKPAAVAGFDPSKWEIVIPGEAK
jgi:hypothetical protein